MKKETYKDVTYYRTKNDVNGNPRYIIHFISIEQKCEERKCVLDRYADTLNFAREFGAKKYRGKDFGGGIVFQSYSMTNLIDNLLNKLNK